MLICGKALTSLKPPFFLNNYSLEKQSSSPQEARQTFPLVFIIFPSPTDMITFLDFFLVVLMSVVFIGHGLCLAPVELVSLIPQGTSIHPMILLLCWPTME